MIIALIVLAVLAVVAAATLVYVTRRTPTGRRTPLQRFADWWTRDPQRPYGPDTDRVAAELSILTRRYDRLV
ncbi:MULTISPECIES: hypothetical protein [Gordonia]|uniref:Uncharacterized protein n=1 Tax=Gordonia amicalis TaxID=89053 RepID=A0AAE4U8S8_9ACTN|nr:MULTISPECIES: hypothetical protein [Gordonia]ATD69942.1 hypothetical protein CNO18_06330 [Gordonia sp. 1D]KAF0967941.1 hypothetical protein BPODLACK_03654 [Gordonia sp. YY1]MBA5848291.1 hypothetical protein [Gordonia amicalis]MCR8897809.1 hypothetical protein [Gordonia sp. GONU]MCZ4578815.1 hypothetical protein [Gordonia amicalis]